MINLYNLYDGGKLVLFLATLGEIREYMDAPQSFKATDYPEGSMYKGRYGITKVYEYKSVPKYPNPPEPLAGDWERECRRYRKYIWTERPGKGVKRLCIRMGAGRV